MHYILNSEVKDTRNFVSLVIGMILKKLQIIYLSSFLVNSPKKKESNGNRIM
jgi:hypothetical protein